MDQIPTGSWSGNKSIHYYLSKMYFFCYQITNYISIDILILDIFLAMKIKCGPYIIRNLNLYILKIIKDYLVIEIDGDLFLNYYSNYTFFI